MAPRISHWLRSDLCIAIVGTELSADGLAVE
jgi:hypothetical protein